MSMSMSSFVSPITRWFDTTTGARVSDTDLDRVDLIRILPFILLHLSTLFVLAVGWSPVAVTVAVMADLIRMFAVTGF